MESRAQILEPTASLSHLEADPSSLGIPPGKGGQTPLEGGALWDWPPGRWEAGFSLLSAKS